MFHFGGSPRNAVDNLQLADGTSSVLFVASVNVNMLFVQVAGNFNLTNNVELFQELVNHGQHPVEVQDTVLLMERIAYHLDQGIVRAD